jgi:hypothetical protein
MRNLFLVLALGFILTVFLDCSGTPSTPGRCNWQCVRGTREYFQGPIGKYPPEKGGCNKGTQDDPNHNWGEPKCNPE